MINYVEENFQRAIDFTLKAEGVISNDPKDTGGLTVFGISSRWYPDLVKKLIALIDEGRANEAIEIAIDFYRINYWQKSGCDVLTRDCCPNLALVLFDTAVNCGVSRAKSFMSDDGNWICYLMKRVVYNTTCETEETHLRGWTKRIARLYKYVKEIK